MNEKTYFIRIIAKDQTHWDSQRDQRVMIFKCGIPFDNIKWDSGMSGPNMELTHLWKISNIDDKTLTLLLLKTSGIIEKIVDNNEKSV